MDVLGRAFGKPAPEEEEEEIEFHVVSSDHSAPLDGMDLNRDMDEDDDDMLTDEALDKEHPGERHLTFEADAISNRNIVPKMARMNQENKAFFVDGDLYIERAPLVSSSFLTTQPRKRKAIMVEKSRPSLSSVKVIPPPPTEEESTPPSQEGKSRCAKFKPYIVFGLLSIPSWMYASSLIPHYLSLWTSSVDAVDPDSTINQTQ